MARTLNLALTGAAARIDRADFQQALEDDYQAELDAAGDRMVAAREELKRLDPTGWEKWWDETLPDKKRGESLPDYYNALAVMIESRLRALMTSASRGLIRRENQ